MEPIQPYELQKLSRIGKDNNHGRSTAKVADQRARPLRRWNTGPSTPLRPSSAVLQRNEMKSQISDKR